MRLNPLAPYLPKYPGPHQVGTVEIELPLPEHLQRTFGNVTVKTLLVRLFYPTTATKGHRPRWTGHGNYTIQGYAKFLGLRQSVLSAASYLGLKWTEIPAFADAPLAPPAAPSNRWPTMLFSHGLGGTRNAYSQIAGSIASGGVVVMAIEHRDNSAAISVVKTDAGEEIIDYISIKESSPSNIQKRRDQMAQRAYEMKLGLELFRTLNTPSPSSPSSIFKIPGTAPLSDFTDSLLVSTGEVLIAGHSFGAATAVHCCKDSSTRLPTDPEGYQFQSEFKASMLLDIWTEVLADSTDRPLTVPSLAIVSEAFKNWSTNFSAVKKLLLQSPSSSSSSPGSGKTVSNKLCWVPGSAHLSQSDFGLLFPTATKYAFKASLDPTVAMSLNLRAVREFLRELGIGQEPEDAAIFHSEEKLVVVEGQ